MGGRGELLQELKDDIKKASKIKYVYTFYKEEIINKKIKKDIIEKSIEDIFTSDEMINILNFEDVELTDDIVNCDTCQEYNYTKNKQKEIKEYVESTIVICKLNLNEYKIDIYMKQQDYTSKLEYESNEQYKIVLVF